MQPQFIGPAGQVRTPCAARPRPPEPEGAGSSDPEVLRAALLREAAERRRAECLAKIQTEVARVTLDLLVREPDIQGFFGAMAKTMVEKGDNHGCGVWLLDDDQQGCQLWMACLSGRVYTSKSADWGTLTLPRESMAAHLFGYGQGWHETVEYGGDDSRLPGPVREFNRSEGVQSVIATPLILGSHNLGWVAITTFETTECDRWWRIALVEAIARQVTLALYQSRLAERSQLEERRKAVLEERNRLARDIHDTLAQGFAAILMQLQAAQREAPQMEPAVAAKLETAVDLARTHMIEARRSVGTLRPNVGDGEDVRRALKRITELAQRTTNVPIEASLEELPRYGDGVEREIIGIVQEALNNAVRHSRARRITVQAATVRSIGVRVSVADDGRGITSERSMAGFGMTSMQERAERIGASLTIVTAPRGGTEVVLAWEPSSLPTQVHAAG
ncbi:MAG TPA: GAF domain-containing sensor histidine kinase [Vicinamibacterales bacterium]|nr:GAF domain-containing sensor histidine kinase [Vicinamibacterales bacterium]